MISFKKLVKKVNKVKRDKKKYINHLAIQLFWRTKI